MSNLNVLPVIVLVFGMAGPAFAQQSVVSLDLKDASLVDALKQVEQESGLRLE